MIKIVFIVEGGLEMGMGHVQHSLTLAGELRDRASIQFVTGSDETVQDQIKQAGFDVSVKKSDDEKFNLLQKLRPGLAIIDELYVSEKLAGRIKSDIKAKLVIFNNLTAANACADIAVTADFGSRFKNIKTRDESTGTIYYYGPRYWILRKEFYDFRMKGKVFSETVKHILLTFGGSDPSNLTTKALDILLGLNRGLKIDVILGIRFEYYDKLNQVLSKYPGEKNNINLYKNIKNMAQLMYKADLVIASPGLSVFEALAVGTPVIVIPQNLRQQEAYEGLLVMINKEDINKLGDMIDKADFSDPRQENIVMMEIGEGKLELVEEILRGVPSN